MGYQENCEAYALYGDPMRDAYEYEENARYDQYDGQRGDQSDYSWELECEWNDLSQAEKNEIEWQLKLRTIEYEVERQREISFEEVPF